MYAMLAWFMLTALACQLQFARTGNNGFLVGYTVLGLMSVYTHLYGWLTIVAAFMAGVDSRFLPRPQRRAWLVAHLIIAAGFLPWISAIAGLLRETERGVSIAFIPRLTLVDFFKTFHFFLNGFSAPVDLGRITTIFATFFVILGLSPLSAAPTDMRRYLTLMLILPLGMSAAGSLLEPMFLPRYHIVSGAILLIAVSAGAAGLPTRRARLGASLLMCVFSIPSLANHYRNAMPFQERFPQVFYPATPRRPFSEVMRTIESTAQDTDVIGHFLQSSLLPMRHYATRNIRQTAVSLHPETFENIPFPRVEHAVDVFPIHLRELFTAGGRFWLVLTRWGVSREGTVPLDELVRYADDHAFPLETWNFTDIQVRHYHWPDPGNIYARDYRLLERFGRLLIFFHPGANFNGMRLTPVGMEGELLSGPDGNFGAGYDVRFFANGSIASTDTQLPRSGTVFIADDLPWTVVQHLDQPSGLLAARLPTVATTPSQMTWSWWFQNSRDRPRTVHVLSAEAAAVLDAVSMNEPAGRNHWWPGRWTKSGTPPWRGWRITTTDAALGDDGAPVRLQANIALPAGKYDAFIDAVAHPAFPVNERARLILRINNSAIGEWHPVALMGQASLMSAYIGSFELADDCPAQLVELEAHRGVGQKHAWADVQRITILRRPEKSRFLNVCDVCRGLDSAWSPNPAAIAGPHFSPQVTTVRLQPGEHSTLSIPVTVHEGLYELWLRILRAPPGTAGKRARLEVRMDGRWLAALDSASLNEQAGFTFYRVGLIQGPGNQLLEITASAAGMDTEAFADIDVIAIVPNRLTTTDHAWASGPHYGIFCESRIAAVPGEIVRRNESISNFSAQNICYHEVLADDGMIAMHLRSRCTKAEADVQ